MVKLKSMYTEKVWSLNLLISSDVIFFNSNSPIFLDKIRVEFGSRPKSKISWMDTADKIKYQTTTSSLLKILKRKGFISTSAKPLTERFIRVVNEGELSILYTLLKRIF